MNIVKLVTRPTTGYSSYLNVNDCIELDETLEMTPKKCREHSLDMVEMELHVSDYDEEDEDEGDQLYLTSRGAISQLL